MNQRVGKWDRWEEYPIAGGDSGPGLGAKSGALDWDGSGDSVNAGLQTGWAVRTDRTDDGGRRGKEVRAGQAEAYLDYGLPGFQAHPRKGARFLAGLTERRGSIYAFP